MRFLTGGVARFVIANVTILAALLASLMISGAARAQPAALSADGGFAATPIAECKTDLRYLNHITGWQTAWPNEWAALVASGDNIAAGVSRWAKADDALAETISVLRKGAANGEAAPAPVIDRVMQQARDLNSVLLNGDARYMFAAADTNEKQRWNALVAQEIAPAIDRFTNFLSTQYRRNAPGKPGLSTTPDGAACYENAVQWWTTLSLSRAEIEAIGARFLSETRADLLKTALPGETFGGLMTRLREAQASDATTSAELIALSQAALTRAQENALQAFLKRPTQPIAVVEMAAHLQASLPAGFYRPPEGDQPASYVINPSRPGERRLMAEVIAFHEGAPGHHLYFAYPREAPPSGYNAGYLEGWAIYAEYVADEIGLYSTTLDRQGMMTKHLWAASRLIVEPGLHLGGWSRGEAIAFMLENTLLSRTEIEIEVDRYIAMPGQSLSYILGADVIMAERERARAKLGDAFDIREFHDVVLAPGVRPLGNVEDDIRAWAKRLSASTKP